MKIIAVGMNYAAHNKELHHSLELSEPTIFMKSDSSLLKDGKPFFIPDFSSEVHYETEIVVRIDRLGISRHGICRINCVRKGYRGRLVRRLIIRL